MSPRISPSQIHSWRKCQRYWGFKRKHREPSSQWAEAGTRAHTVAETWLRDGTPPDASTQEGRCILAGIHYLPMPKSDVVLEHKFSYAVDGVQYNGIIDMLFGYDPGRIIVVGDHKTCGSYRYALDEHTLAEDPQGLIYGKFAVDTFDVDYVGLHWVYYLRDGKSARPVSIVLHRDSVQKRFEELHQKESLPIVQSRDKDPMTLEPNFEHCHKMFGKACPFLGMCTEQATPEEKTARMMHGL